MRASDTAARRRDLYERGFVSRRELEESEGVAVRAREQVCDTRRRLAQTDSVLAETLAAIEWARAAATTTSVITPGVIGSRDGADLTDAAVDGLDRFFVSRFARSLPVSALGQTPVHDRLGLDHRRALDVAVHPDSAEGRASSVSPAPAHPVSGLLGHRSRRLDRGSRARRSRLGQDRAPERGASMTVDICPDAAP